MVGGGGGVVVKRRALRLALERRESTLSGTGKKQHLKRKGKMVREDWSDSRGKENNPPPWEKTSEGACILRDT